MKKVIFLYLTIMITLISLSGFAQTQKNETPGSATNKVEAYYFHNTSRCITCMTVESEAKADLLSLYGDQVVFKALNLEEEASKPIANQLKISGQTLLLVKGNKKINITNEGFLYARTNPAKLKSIIKEKVDGLLNN